MMLTDLQSERERPILQMIHDEPLVALVIPLLESILAPTAPQIAFASSAASIETMVQQPPKDCAVRNPLDQIAPTLRDFGTGGQAYVTQHNTGFRGSEGYSGPRKLDRWIR